MLLGVVWGLGLGLGRVRAMFRVFVRAGSKAVTSAQTPTAVGYLKQLVRTGNVTMGNLYSIVVV